MQPDVLTTLLHVWTGGVRPGRAAGAGQPRRPPRRRAAAGAGAVGGRRASGRGGVRPALGGPAAGRLRRSRGRPRRRGLGASRPALPRCCRRCARSGRAPHPRPGPGAQHPARARRGGRASGGSRGAGRSSSTRTRPRCLRRSVSGSAHRSPPGCATCPRRRRPPSPPTSTSWWRFGALAPCDSSSTCGTPMAARRVTRRPSSPCGARRPQGSRYCTPSPGPTTWRWSGRGPGHCSSASPSPARGTGNGRAGGPRPSATLTPVTILLDTSPRASTRCWPTRQSPLHDRPRRFAGGRALHPGALRRRLPGLPPAVLHDRGGRVPHPPAATWRRPGSGRPRRPQPQPPAAAGGDRSPGRRGVPLIETQV